MFLFVIRRLLYFIPMLLALSVLAFAVMQLQPGDFLSKHALTLSQETLAQLRERYGLDQPPWVQYLKWIGGIITRGDFGMSFETQQPVFNHLFINGNRLGWTLLLTVITFVFSWALALPLGIYLATYAYTAVKSPWSLKPLWGRTLAATKRVESAFRQRLFPMKLDRIDWGAVLRSTWQRSRALFHFFHTVLRWGLVRFINLLGITGLALPNFLTALLILWLLVAVFEVGARHGLGISGLFDVEYVTAPWSWDKLVNFFWHLWPVILVVGLANMAQLIRYTRANLLDVLGEPYIQTARAKGLKERAVIYKHAVRNALNPLVSLLGFWIPLLFEGMLVAAFVLQLPVVERAYWRALVTEDQYVMMAGLLFFGFVLLVGNLLSDLCLALVNPKIRYE